MRQYYQHNMSSLPAIDAKRTLGHKQSDSSTSLRHNNSEDLQHLV